MKRYKLLTAFLFITGLFIAASFSASAFDLTYSGGSVGGSTGATGSSSGYTIANETAWQNIVGYRFSVVDESGNLKAGSHPSNCYLDYINGAAPNYQKFLLNSGYPATKVQIAQGNNISTTVGYNANYEYTNGNAGFATATPQNPAEMEGWIQDSSGNYQNLRMIYSKCNLNFEKLPDNDYVLIEPIVTMKLAGVQTAATPTELAMYGASVSGGTQYNGANGNLQNAGSSTLWNLQYYVNREFPNLLYVSSWTPMYGAVDVLSSGRYTYDQIIQCGIGCSVLKVSNVVSTQPVFSPNLTVFACEDWKGTPDRIIGTSGYGWNMGGGSFSDYHVAAGYPRIGDAVSFRVKYNTESQNIRVRQYVNHGGAWKTRDVVLDSTNPASYQWMVNFDGADSNQPTTKVENSREFYFITAKMDWIDESGNVLKSGAVKSFYFPVQPTIRVDEVRAYDLSGNICATTTAGKVYVGQKIHLSYGLSSPNTWSPSLYLRAQLQKYDGTNFIPAYTNAATGNADLYVDRAVLPSNTKYFASSMGQFRVPELLKDDEIRIKFWNSWTKDVSHTEQTTYQYLPVIKADAQITNIELYDSKTNQAVTSVFSGKTYYPVYTYYNNTDVAIWVDCYENNTALRKQVKIDAHSDCRLTGSTTGVKDSAGSLVLQGCIYLEGADFGNTAWESNGDNNVKAAVYPVNPKRDITISFVEPNSSYRTGTTVISTFKVACDGDAVLPSDGLTVKLSGNYTDTNSVKHSLPVQTKSVVIPSDGNNIVYFQWEVPVDCKEAFLLAAANPNRRTIEENYNNDSCGTKVRIQEKKISLTADTKFVKSRPADWYDAFRSARINISDITTSPTEKAGWSEWSYNEATRKFEKNTYIARLHISSSLKPDSKTEKFSKKLADGSYQMQSGYGYELNCTAAVTTTAPADSYLFAQSGNLYLPDYKYSSALNQYCSLDSLGGGLFALQKSPYSLVGDGVHDYRRIQFTELWYPDGDYIPKVYLYDCWTPAGMISEFNICPTLTIRGSMYDNWYINHKPN